LPKDLQRKATEEFFRGFLGYCHAYFQTSNFGGVIWQVSVPPAIAADHFGFCAHAAHAGPDRAMKDPAI
jgi:hypothetical protein